jgi:hypothetical protein
VRIVFAVEDEAHWDALLPLLRWLFAARCDLIALRRGFGYSAPVDFLALAQLLEARVPRMRWRPRLKVRESDLLVGTVDDLRLLLELRQNSGAAFVATARLPLPALFFSGPVPDRLALRTSRDRDTPAGQMLCPGGRDAIAALVERTHHLPFLLTGCPERVHPGAPAPPDSFVVIHPGDLDLGSRTRRDVHTRHRRLLARLLVPLAACGAPIQVRCALAPEVHQDVASVALVVASLEDRGVLDPGSVEVVIGHGWGSLDSARAVLALREIDLLRALASGLSRSWWVPLLEDETEEELLRPSEPLEPCALIGSDPFDRWVTTKGWGSPSDLATHIADTLGQLSTPRTAEQTAQVILSATAR